MKRRPDWPEQLADFIAARRDTPFAWGGNDCCSFAADCIAVMTDADPMADLRGTYLNEWDAGRTLAALGGVEAAVDARLPAVPVLSAQRGDVLLFDIEGRPTLAVCFGEYAYGPGTQGLARVATLTARRGWGVGRET